MVVYFWASGLILSPQSHILKSLMWGLAFVEVHSLRNSMQIIGCDGGIQEPLAARPWAKRFFYGDHAPASSTTSRIIMSDSSDQMEFSPTNIEQVTTCEKLRDTVTGISALHMSNQGMDGRSPSPRNSFKDLYLSTQAMIRRKEEMVSELKTLPPCTIPECQDHKIPSTSVEEEINFVPSPPVIENKIKTNSKSKKILSKKRK
ncbi:hypothetical protein TNCV_3574211 [Trichonephila clavipes]|nr:hypothetical protein TNCV_3574211 [Trichonephila clavipes]